MIEFLITSFLLAWIISQFFGHRAERWLERGRALEPFLRLVAADARAVWESIRTRRLDAEWRRLDEQA